MQYLPVGTKGHAVSVDIEAGVTVQQLIEQFKISNEMAFLVMVNGVYIQPEDRQTTILSEQDTLAIWPKVAGG